jgi:glyoxylate/hydroxypyruvate reductase
MTLAKPKVLFQGMLPPGWNAIEQERFGAHGFEGLLAGRDTYRPEEISYFSGFRPAPGFLKLLPGLKAVISLGAGVDGFLRDPEYPLNVPLVRFVDPTLIREMAQYVTMHVLIIHRGQRFFDAAQRQCQWRQRMLARPSCDTRIGMLGLGDIGTAIAQSLIPFDFQLSGWSQSRKHVPGIRSYAGDSEVGAFLAQCDICVCVLPLTDKTGGILNAALFAQLPGGAWVINVARGGHLIEQDLIAALDSGHLGGAVLDVFQREPLPPDSPVWSHPKITATPHIAALTDTKAALAFIGDSVRRAEGGEPLLHVVDPARGY